MRHGRDGSIASARARRSGVASREARDLIDAHDVIDLHIDSYIWTRVARYDLGREHRAHLPGHRYLAQADLPRLRAAGFSGSFMSITTNPFRRRSGRADVLGRNVDRLTAALERGGARVVDDLAGYRAARSAGQLASFLALQGGNALSAADFDSADPSVQARLRRLTRVTLVHLTRSMHGASSAPGGGGGRGLTRTGRALIEVLRDRSIVLDLAHAAPSTFWAALDAHGRDRPVIVSHTGVSGVNEHWRNVDDAQIRAIAETGGVIGVIAHRSFLTRPARTATIEDVVAHLEHVRRIGGDDALAIGTDFDGAIVPVRGFETASAIGNLVDALLRRGWPHEVIGQALGANALRVIGEVRPGS